MQGTLTLALSHGERGLRIVLHRRAARPTHWKRGGAACASQVALMAGSDCGTGADVALCECAAMKQFVTEAVSFIGPG